MVLNKNITYKIITFGCQMNARDSEKLAGVLEEKGYNEANDENVADIVIFNTCTVRENANKKLYGRIGQLKNSYMKNKEKIIGICGCMMQENDEVEIIKSKYPYVKLIFGTHNIDDFSNLIDEVLASNKKVFRIYNESDNIEKVLPTKRVYSFKCGINIMFGCNNFCTYCIVPYVRGRERSRDVDNIIKEIENAVSEGVVEIMLLGQNVNSYNGKSSEKYKFSDNNHVTFPELLNQIAKIDGLKRIRFMTSHPKDLSDDLITVIKNNDNICSHIHLPVQSGSNKILHDMNRHYTREKYLEIIKKLKENIKDVGISTDIIVGFPGETEEDFNDTLTLINEVNFDAVFTFEYSKRTGTKAANMDNQVPTSVVKDRFKRLLTTVENCSSKNADKYVGHIMDGLVEGEDKVSGKLTARLANNYLVHFNGEKELIGKIIDLKISKSCKFYFEGEAIL